MLRIVPPNPTHLVALFHGLGNSPKSLEPMVSAWATALPKTAFVLPDGAGDWVPYDVLREKAEPSDRIRMRSLCSLRLLRPLLAEASRRCLAIRGGSRRDGTREDATSHDACRCDAR